MKNKTCGQCKHLEFDPVASTCKKKLWICADSTPACYNFEPKKPTNGDKINQMSNEELVMILTEDGCKHCIYRVANSKGFTVTCRYPDKTRIPDCNAGTLAWLNAPAESEG